MTDRRPGQVTRQDILDRRRQRVAAYGLDLAWLERLEHETDTRTVASWLEDHNFTPWPKTGSPGRGCSTERTLRD